jgi:hypothetical protein
MMRGSTAAVTREDSKAMLSPPARIIAVADVNGERVE